MDHLFVCCWLVWSCLTYYRSFVCLLLTCMILSTGRQSTAGSGYKDGYRRCMQETVNFFANKTPRNCLPSGLFKHLIGVFERLPNGTSGGYRAPNACNPIRVTPHRPTSECSKQMGHYLEHFSVSNKCSQPDLSPAQVITPADNLCPTPSCTLHNRAQFWRPWA